jgi:ABC-type sugar transport system permease subunit
MSATAVLPPDEPSAEPPRAELSKSAAKYAKRKALRPYLILTPTLLLTLGILIPFFAAIYLSFTDFTLRSSDYSFI